VCVCVYIFIYLFIYLFIHSHILYYTAHIQKEKNKPEIFIVPPGFYLVMGV